MKNYMMAEICLKITSGAGWGRCGDGEGGWGVGEGQCPEDTQRAVGGHSCNPAMTGSLFFQMFAIFHHTKRVFL